MRSEFALSRDSARIMITGMDVLAAVGAGALAGLGVAVPLGAIGVLLLHEGLDRGWRSAAWGATAVALVDLAYAAVAVSAGAGVTALLAGHERTVQLLAAGVLTAVAARGLWRVWRPGPAPEVPGPGRVVRRFVGLTALNPVTAVYFVVLAAGLGGTLAGWTARAAFAAGVFAGSWAWQLVLAGVGALAGARLPRWARTATGVIGHIVVAGFAMALAIG